MTTKVRITHLDSIDPVKVLVKDQAGNTVEQVALLSKGDEHEMHVYSGRTLEVVEGTVDPVAVTGSGLQTKSGGVTADSASPTDGHGHKVSK